MTPQKRLIVALVVSAVFGCGHLPLISENRFNFPPWEKLPEGNGITYIGKFTHDPGIDPLYLAKIEYEDDAALQLVIDTFGLVPKAVSKKPSTFTIVLKTPPLWFPLEGVTHLYVYPNTPDEYLANLWVNADEKTMILERAWW